jgi:hypothetical protein
VPQCQINEKIDSIFAEPADLLEATVLDCGKRKICRLAKTTIRRVQEQSLRRMLTPNSPRLHHHLLLLCDRPLRLHPRPRRVLVEGSRRHLPSDQVSPSQGVPDTFQSWSHGTATPGEQPRGAWPLQHGLANNAELPFRALRITLRFSCWITPRWGIALFFRLSFVVHSW